ncbi:MAG: ferritin [Candidatus Thermoplasmatota archaeon]|nr:ferritin [Candidatus Thermoplasmatota archaeon]
MIKKNIEKAINDQINEEMFSSYLYLSMAAHFESENLPGMAKWMRVQSQEETAHAMKFFDYLVSRGGNVNLKAIAQPEKQWKSPLAAFEAAYKHEQHITGCIEKMVDLAQKEKDHATYNMLQWFIDEQVEEEENADGIVQRLKMIKDNPGMLFMMDHNLGQRKE